MASPARTPPRRRWRLLVAGLALLAIAALVVASVLRGGRAGDGGDGGGDRRGGQRADGTPAARPSPTATRDPAAPATRATPAIAWRASRAVGATNGGRLARGVMLPAEGRDFFTWDPVRKRSPNRAWRRWGTDRLLRTLLRVLRQYRTAHPGAPRVGIGDLSRPRGGSFDRRFGGLGHASHQNGLDVDVYYPRKDGLERRPYAPRQVDRRLAQDLVDRFVAHNARYVFVGPRVRLGGRAGVVEQLAFHDDHLHFRLRRG